MKAKVQKLHLFCLLLATLPDQTEADLDVQSATVGADGALSITAQKVLKDKTTGETVKDGDSITLTEDATGEDAKNVSAAVQTAALNLYAKTQVPAAETQPAADATAVAPATPAE